MPFLSKMISFWNNLFRRQRVERDLNDELQAYVEEMAERKIQAGLAPEAARDAALLELGGIERIKDLVRQQRVGLRNLRTAGAMVVIATVAFASGASAAVAAMRWSTPKPAAPQVTEKKHSSIPFARQKLQGRLVDKATGEPVPNAEVGLQAFAPLRRYTFTDEQGRFDFTDPPHVGYRLEVGNERWFVSGSGNLSFNSRTFDRFSVVTPEVVVKDEAGQPLEGERIELKGAVFSKSDAKLLDWLQRSRSFKYSSGAIELSVTNPPPKIKRAAFGISTVDVQSPISSRP